MAKFKSKIIILLIMALPMIFAVSALSACGGTPTLERLERDGFNVEVRYDPNGGTFGPGMASNFAVFLRPGMRVPKPGHTAGIAEALRDLYQPDPTWHLPELDNYGYPLRCEYTDLVITVEEPWDFDQTIDEPNTMITLFASWERAFIFRFWFEREGEEEDGYVDFRVIESNGTISTNPDNVRMTGALGLRARLQRDRYGGGAVQSSLRGIFNYEDRACAIKDEIARLTDVELGAIVHRAWIYGEYDDEGNRIPNQGYEYTYHDLFTTWLDGVFTFVYSPYDMPRDGNISLEADISFNNWTNQEGAEGGDLNRTIFGGFDYAGTILGNGHTISDLHVIFNDQWARVDFGLFGNFFGTMRDITFENIHIEVRHTVVPPTAQNLFPRRIGFFAGVVGAVDISNVILGNDNRLTVHDPVPDIPGVTPVLQVGYSVPGFLFGHAPGGWTPGITGTINTHFYGHRTNAGLAP